MINLSMPSESHNLFIAAGAHLMGPFSPGNAVREESFSYRHELDALSQGDHFHHEKDVGHLKFEGDVKLSQTFNGMKAVPKYNYAHAISFSAYNLRLKTDTTETYHEGYATLSGLKTRTDGYGNYFHKAYIATSGTRIEYIEVSTRNNYPNNGVSAEHIVYEITEFTSPRVSYRTSIKALGSAGQLNKNWSPSTVTYSRILQVFEELVSVVAASSVYMSMADIRQANASRTLSPASAKMSIDSLIVEKLNKQDFLLAPVHYGDLASEAAKTVNRNNVNMIAFLKDLKNPKALIPKLKELSKLKTHAGNYLAVNYGILPTVSDVQSIVGAFEKIKPYIDTNGFKTYNAVHSDSRVSGDVSESLEQRIKIAVEDEDIAFIKAMNGIHSAGFAPTLENMWDLVPYSFVLDWFIDIGGFLEQIDSNLSLLRLNIRYATMSRKRTLSVVLTPSETSSLSGTISVVSYQRWTTDLCPLPPLSLSNDITVSDHWLEAGALILQRAK